MKNKKILKGFTLIELLIVITIIGILAAALLPSVLSAPARARDAARVADLTKISSALETYNADNGRYPDGEICINDMDASFTKYFSGGRAPQDPSKLVIKSCPQGSYYYCGLKSGSQTYLLAAKTERDESATGELKDLDNIDCSGGSPQLSFTKPATGGNGIYVIVQ